MSNLDTSSILSKSNRSSAAKQMRNDGLSFGKIAKELGVSKTRIVKILEKNRTPPPKNPASECGCSLEGKKTSKKSYTPLDTLAQNVTKPLEDDVGMRFDLKTKCGNSSTLLKRAKAKYLTVGIVKKLVDISDSPLKKGYWNTYHCADVLEKNGDTIITHYCKNRWCLVCNRIRTARLIKQYKPLLDLWTSEQYFITLTIPNVPADQLDASIREMQKVFTGILAKMKQRTYNDNSHAVRLEGLRKLECTYNPVRNDYHPHYHCIVHGFVAAEFILTEWLRRFPLANVSAQDIRKGDNNSAMELFKYFTKLISGKSKTKKNRSIHPASLDVIFRAIKGKQIFRAFGVTIPKVDEDLLDDEVDSLLETVDSSMLYSWEQEFGDWISQETGEVLTGYVPSDGIKELVKAL
jgi:predicted transcriptional regulator